MKKFLLNLACLSFLAAFSGCGAATGTSNAVDTADKSGIEAYEAAIKAEEELQKGGNAKAPMDGKAEAPASN